MFLAGNVLLLKSNELSEAIDFIRKVDRMSLSICMTLKIYGGGQAQIVRFKGDELHASTSDGFPMTQDELTRAILSPETQQTDN